MNRLFAFGFMAAMTAATSAQAATITALGLNNDLNDAWRSTSVAKPLPVGADPNGDNAYGNDGYHVAGVADSLPGYVSGVADNAANFLSSGFSPIDNPSLAISATVANMDTGLWYANGSPTFTYVNFFDITLSATADFVLTVILDTNSYNTLGVQVTGPGGASGVILTPFTGDTVPDYAFFRIRGDATDVFTVALQTEGNGRASTSGLGFEHLLPEPASLSLFGLAGIMAMRRKRAKA